MAFKVLFRRKENKEQRYELWLIYQNRTIWFSDKKSGCNFCLPWPRYVQEQ